jgi:hypothetical protein
MCLLNALLGRYCVHVMRFYVKVHFQRISEIKAPTCKADK